MTIASNILMNVGKFMVATGLSILQTALQASWEVMKLSGDTLIEGGKAVGGAISAVGKTIKDDINQTSEYYSKNSEDNFAFKAYNTTKITATNISKGVWGIFNEAVNFTTKLVPNIASSIMNVADSFVHNEAQNCTWMYDDNHVDTAGDHDCSSLDN